MNENKDETSENNDSWDLWDEIGLTLLWITWAVGYWVIGTYFPLQWALYTCIWTVVEALLTIVYLYI